VDIVNLSPIEAVKLVDQGFLEALMRVCSFLIFAAPSEVVTHAIEFLGPTSYWGHNRTRDIEQRNRRDALHDIDSSESFSFASSFRLSFRFWYC